MAEMIPDHLPPGASAGEKRVFDVLQRLPNDCIVYWEPVVARRYPDFIVIIPDLGLLVIEVKGWHCSHIVEANTQEVRIQSSAGLLVHKHPSRQARDYMNALRDACRSHASSTCLLQLTGPHEGKFVFPFAHCAVLSQITSDQIGKHPSENLRSIFPSESVVTADILQVWSECDGSQLKTKLGVLFTPTWVFPRMTHRQIDTLRAVIHPEVCISPPPAEIASSKAPESQTTPESQPVPPVSSPTPVSLISASTRPAPKTGPHVANPAREPKPVTLKVLDLKQERDARSIGDGHRLVYGVAGSGKTVLLIARAKLFAQLEPTTRVLVLCFNLQLATYLGKVLSTCPNIKVHHFHGWAGQNGCSYRRRETEEALGERLLEVFRKGHGDAAFYDAILVDEAQDFSPTWFRCILAAMKEPVDGNLFITGDGSQGLYSRGQLSWKKLGVRAQGRTRRLERNYRNTREILEAASPFAAAGTEDDEDSLVQVVANPSQAIRSNDCVPILIRAAKRQGECIKVKEIVQNLLKGRWAERQIERLDPSDIAILYPRRPWDGLFRPFIEDLAKIAPTVWLSERRGRTGQDARIRVCEPGVKIQTIHSAKGLQYKAVILMFAQDLVYKGKRKEEPDGDDQDSAADSAADPETELDVSRRLLYVALTRPEEYLAVSYTASEATEFCDIMASSGKFRLV
jgi:hypothetical protein